MNVRWINICKKRKAPRKYHDETIQVKNPTGTLFFENQKKKEENPKTISFSDPQCNGMKSDDFR